ncbi:MAG TPA: ribonuclease HI family protein [candidate division WWE3 bacterium]|uniref:Ribonuclease HI family protein n=1 Tax=candidate division WWE3 bacterium TaxID=2053526 RepID=A0A7C1P666_UNCKA|nr:ribonuclease HI family protein [candidate division WWE3 bacterium]
MRFFLFADGASRGNPGPAGAGVVLKDREGHVVAEKSQFLGRMTNNEAEYRALLLGFAAAREHIKDKGATLVCLMDSQLVVFQVKGLYKIKAPHLRELLTKVKIEERGFTTVLYKLIPREKNARADELANEALGKR